MKAYKCDNCLYDEYYSRQVGGNLPVFTGSKYQRGHGLGGLFSGLFKAATPLLRRGALRVGKQLLKTGTKVADDVLSGQRFKHALKSRGREGLKDLLQPIKRKRQQRRRVIVKKRPRRDIFN